MSILDYNEIKEGKIIIYNNEPCEVLDSHVARTQQRKPQNQTKLRSLINGRTYNATFQVSDKAEEADIFKKEIKFLYQNKREYWFCDPNNPKERFLLKEEIMDSSIKFLKQNDLATSVILDDDGEEKIIKVKAPIKVELKVIETPPNIKGDTKTGGNKPAKLESGATVNVPLFINEGDIVRVNTETGQYVERV